MLRAIWGSASAPEGSLAALSPADRELRLLSAIEGLEMIMNDDLEGASKVFGRHEDAYHLWGLSIAAFIRAMLSSEKKEILACASPLDRALASLEKELSYSKACPGSYFEHGTEFRFCIANTQLESAIVGFLSESIPEAMRAAWKLKSAYNTLHNLNVYVEGHNIGAHVKRSPQSSDHLDANGTTTDLKANVSHLAAATGAHTSLTATDYFTYCGAVCGFGIITLVISLLPAKVSRLLAIIGFKGNRDDALVALWSVSDATNIQGALAILGLLTYHGELLGACDIVNGENEQMTRCSSILALALNRYPDSALWQLQAAKMQQRSHDLYTGITMLRRIEARDQMKQVESFKEYELGLSYIYTHQWQLAADQLVEVAAGNEWSKGLYHYLVGCCYVELYANHKDVKYAAAAESWFEKAPPAIGKKLGGKPFPLEVYLRRKITKWKSFAPAKSKYPILDGITVPPIVEFIHVFNAWKKMSTELLKDFKTIVQRQGSIEDKLDDKVVRTVCLTAISRRLDDSNALALIGEVNTLSTSDLKHLPHAEYWALADSFYETACCIWARDGQKSSVHIRSWLEKARNVPDNEFEGRLGLRSGIALQTIDEKKSIGSTGSVRR